MGFLKSARVLAAVLAALAGFLAWKWRPAEQVRLHTEHFLDAVERRNWAKARTFVAENYTDRWGHDQGTMVGSAQRIFQQFLFVKIERTPVAITLGDSSALVRWRVKMSGSGGPLAALVIERVNGLQEPFLFSWQRQSWKPWDWQLVRLDQPALEDRDPEW